MNEGSLSWLQLVEQFSCEVVSSWSLAVFKHGLDAWRDAAEGTSMSYGNGKLDQVFFFFCNSELSDVPLS